MTPVDPSLPDDQHDPRRQRLANRAVTLAAILTAIFACLIVLHVTPVNGPPYFPWAWARLPLVRAVCVVAIVAGHLGLVAFAFRLCKTHRFVLAVALATIAAFGLRVGLSVATSEPIGLAGAAEVTADPYAGSFFTVAQQLSGRPWTLADYPGLMPYFPLHAGHKAPGPMLMWVGMLRLADGDVDLALRFGVMLIGLISALIVPMTAVVARQLGSDRGAALYAGTIASLMPGTIVFFPLFDPAYATWTLIGTSLWIAACKQGPAYAAAFGAWLAATLFVVFNVLPIGLYLAIVGLWIARRATPDPRRAWVRLATCTVVAIVATVVTLALLEIATGYDALATLRVALERQAEMQRTFGDVQRPYRLTVFWDLYDATLGVGYGPALLCLVAIASNRRSPLRVPAMAAITLWLVLAVGALLPAETARVWAFTFPLLAIPAGAMLAEASGRARWSLLLAMAILLAAMTASMIFVAIAPVTMSA